MKSRTLLIGLFLSILAVIPPAQATVTLLAPSNYQVGYLDVGDAYYLDRAYTITSQPAGFENFSAILTHNDDKSVSDTVHLRFNLPADGTVYVAYDSRATSLPSWLSGWTGAGSVGTTDVTMNLYSKDFLAGEVILGGNRCCGAAGASSNYFVYVQEGAVVLPFVVTPTSMTLAPSDSGTATLSGGTTPYASVSSSDPGVAAVLLVDDIITVNALAAGTAVVTAMDGAGQAAILNVVVTADLAVSPDALTFMVGGVETCLITGGIGDYIAASSNSSVASASLSGNALTIEALSEGSATITITDEDLNTVTVTVTVKAPLSVDQTVVDLDLDTTVSATVTISGGTGPYTAISGNQNVASVSLSGSTLTVTGVSVGNVTVTITDALSEIITISVNVGGTTITGLEQCPKPPFIIGSTATPNILLILDHSGSMGNGAGSKWEVAKTVLKEIIDEFPDVRFGLMRMDGSDYSGDDQWYSSSKVVRQGGKLLKPCGTPGAEIKNYIDNWGNSNTPQTWTNLAETLATAGQYFATVIENGNRVGKGPAGFGYYEKNYSYTIGTDTYDATLTDDKGVTIDTTSPIQYECQKSFIIFITDGLANYDNDWSTVTDDIGDFYTDGETTDCADGAVGCTGQGTYFDDVALYLHAQGNDMRSDLPGDQILTTYVVGYQVTDPMLQQAAINGGGQYYTTTDTSQLKASLTSAIQDILASISSGTAVSTISTSSESEDYLIRAKFLPNTWQGYLEAFTLPYADGDTPVWEAGAVLAATTIANRNIYTYMSSETPQKQVFTATNAALKTHLSGEWGVSETEAADGINTIRGESNAWPLGDIIYSTPTSVGGPKFYYTENAYQTFKENNRNRTKMIYVGANDGMLHAFQASDGAETWAFIPENLQTDLQYLVAGGCHRYYVDLTPLVADIYNGSVWKTVLIGGNRLGGTGYFCLDITDPAHDQFSVIWNHIPFSDRKSSTVPAVGKIQGGGIDQWLAIITSGYHEGTSDGKIAAFNFSDGGKEAFWFDGTTTVDELATQAKAVGDPYYTLSSPAALDSDDDGYLDLIYAGDTRGTLWKFYYDYVDQVWKKFSLFETGGQPITAKPDLVFDEEGKLRIFFGTGKYLVASDKMNSTRNAFYCLVEQPVSTADANDDHYTGTVALDKATDLVDTTNVKTQAAFDSLTNAEKDQISDKGWYFQMDAPAGPAERILSSSLAVAGIVFFTSFLPNSDVCGYGGSARLYAINYKSSLPGRNEEDEPVLTTQTLTERYIDLGHGLPSKPLFYFDKNEKKSRLLIQTSDTTVHQEEVNLEARPMAVTSWRNR